MSKIILNLTEKEFLLLASSVSVHKNASRDIPVLRQQLTQLQAKLFKQTKSLL